MVDLMEAVREAVPAVGSLSPAGLIDTMAALHHTESVLVERKLAVIAALSDHRLCEAAHDEIDCGAEIAESEVGAALTVGRGEAGRLINLGTALSHRLPRMREAMAAGLLDAYRAGLIERATRTVAAEFLAEVERLALAKILAPAGSDGVGLTGQRARNAIAGIIGRLDPAGVREHRRRAANERFVGVSVAEDAMMHLFGSLPAAQGRKLDVRLRELANTVCRADGRTVEQRKADALGALVDGLSVLPCACGREDCPQPTGDRPTARKPLVHVILLGSTLDGEDEESGYLDGYGLIDAEYAQTLATDAAIEYVRVPDDVRYQRAQNTAPDSPATDTTAETTGTTDADANHGDSEAAGRHGPPLPDSAYVYRPNAILDAWLRILCGTCQWPHCDAPAWNADLDHDEPFDHADPSRGGKTTATGMKPYCRTHHRIKHSGYWRERRNPDRSIDYVSPPATAITAAPPATSTCSASVPTPSLNPAATVGPAGDGPGQKNKAASIRAERRRQQGHIDLKKTRHTPVPNGQSPPPDDDEPCPF